MTSLRGVGESNRIVVVVEKIVLWFWWCWWRWWRSQIQLWRRRREIKIVEDRNTIVEVEEAK